MLRSAERSAGTLAATQRTYAALDRAITPERFVAPDLHSPGALAAARRAGVDVAARRAGVDVDDRASVDAADRRYSARQAAEHLARVGAR